MDHRQHVLDRRDHVNALVLQWHRLGCKIAGGYARTFHLMSEIDDMCSEAVVAMVRAAETYDPARGFKFPTYAGRCVAYAMINYYRQSVKRGFTAVPERPPYAQQRVSVTLRMPSGDSKSVSVVDLLLAPVVPQYGDDVTPDEVSEAIRSYLTPRERRVIEHRFQDEMSLEEIGGMTWEKAYRRTGRDHVFARRSGTITREGIRQIQNRALGKLREWFEDEPVPV